MFIEFNKFIQHRNMCGSVRSKSMKNYLLSSASLKGVFLCIWPFHEYQK